MILGRGDLVRGSLRHGQALEDEEEEGGHEVNLEGVGEAGEELEGDKIGDDQGGEEREGGVRPEIAGF